MNVYTTLEDSELLQLLKEGDERAFECIYKRYVHDLYRFAGKNISVPEDRQEIIQEVFEDIWKRHEELRILNLKHYLFNMVKYKVIKYFKQKGVKKRFLEYFMVAEAVYETLSEAEKEYELASEILLSKIDLLPEKWRDAVKLKVHEDLSYGKIAERMRVSPKSVDNYIFRAYGRLRELLRNVN